MSQADLERAIERMATDEAFARTVRADPGSALTGYDLTDAERQSLSGLGTESVPTSAAQPAALKVRRSKSSMLGIGAVGLVAAGAATYGAVSYRAVQPPPTYARYLTVNSSPRDQVSVVSLGGGPDVAKIQAPGGGVSRYLELSVTKPVDSMSPQLMKASVDGVHLSTTVTVQRNGSDWEVYELPDAIVSSVQLKGGSGGDAQPTETVTFNGSITISYPTG